MSVPRASLGAWRRGLPAVFVASFALCSLAPDQSFALGPPISGVLPTLAAVAVVRWESATGIGNPSEPEITPLLTVSSNPFSATTTLHYTLLKRERTVIEIFDVGGRSIAMPIDAWLSAGVHSIAWDGRDRTGRSLPAGLYFVRLRSGALSLERKVVRLR